MSLINKPVVNKFEYIRCGIPPPGDLDAVGEIPATLLKTGGITCVNPKDPRLGRLFSDSVTDFDRKLRFPYDMLAMDNPLVISTYPTPPRPTSAMRAPGAVPFS